MNIVVLDGYTANPNDLSWEPLEAFGKLTIYDRTSADELIKRAQNADIILTNKCRLKGLLWSGKLIVRTSPLMYRVGRPPWYIGPPSLK